MTEPARTVHRRRLRLPESGGARFLAGIVATVLAVAVVATIVDAVAPNPSGPASSSYATSEGGFAGWAELLERGDRQVRALREEPADDALGRPPGTVVLLDAGTLPDEQTAALRRFAQRGGTVVAGGADTGPWVADLLDDRTLLPGVSGPRSVRPLAPAPETAGVARVESAGDSSWIRSGPSLPVLGASAREALLVIRQVGRGRVAALADSSPLTNERLAAADNAAFALALAGPRGTRVTFVESVHGYGAARGFAALPLRLKVALALLAAAALALIVARWPRFGPPEPPSRDLPPPRRAYVEALAATLSRGRTPAAAAAPVQAAAIEHLRRRAALPADAPAEAIAAAAPRLGLDPHETASLTRPPSAEADVLALGRALAKLQPPGG